MVTFLKKYGLIIILVIAFGIFIFLYTRRKAVSFDFNLEGNVSNLLNSLTSKYADTGAQKGIGIYLDVPLTTTITNKSAVQAVFQALAGSIFYEGEPIMQTKAGSSNLSRIEVPANSSKPVTDSVQVLINPSSIKFFSEIIKGNKPAVKYNFNATVFGKPQSFSNITTVSGTSSEKITYDTARCCNLNNPCGWSKSLYDEQCGSRRI